MHKETELPVFIGIVNHIDGNGIEEYQKTNPAKWITVPIEEMSIIYRILNEGLPDGQGNTIAELKNRVITGRPSHESIVYYEILRNGLFTRKNKCLKFIPESWAW
jgi:hypothetical protein